LNKKPTAGRQSWVFCYPDCCRPITWSRH